MSRNRLGDETSPYLLQHKDNPVHWWAWGPDALKESEQTGKPILLSIGYAACHWCHVMAHESFEDQATADVMNELFVNIKVDREERPDIDTVYMSALHSMNEQGGWPLTMFLDTHGHPFWGGTYFPKSPGFGRPAFKGVLASISKIFKDEPDKVTHNAGIILNALKHQPTGEHRAPITDDLLKDLATRMTRACDVDYGGIQGAPKFPQWTFFWFLWRAAMRYGDDAAKQAVLTTLTNICQGGIYDHLGGGFSRYSVDERWLVPHFEKMLYDNALLVDILTEAFRETANPLFERRIEETIGWLICEMTTKEGGFAASFDADSEGIEGKFYVWTPEEIKAVLGNERGQDFCDAYDVTRSGNFEDSNILNRLDNADLRDFEYENDLDGMRMELFKERSKRVAPGWDDKVLADWNGLMIASLTRAGQVFQRPDWIDHAKTAFQFIDDTMTTENRLHHSCRAGKKGAIATSSDYANMILAAIRLHEATGQNRYLKSAIEWTDTLHAHYWLPDKGRYAATSNETTDVIARLSTGTDDATPNANSIQLSNLSILALLTGDDRYREQAAMLVESFATDIAQNLTSHTGLLGASMDLMSGTHVVIAGEEGAGELHEAVFKVSLPGAIVTTCKKDSRETTAENRPPVWAQDKTSQDGKAAAYSCLGMECAAPVTDPRELIALLKKQRATVV